MRAEAESRVKATLLIEEIAKAEKIEATPADVGVRARSARAPVRAAARSNPSRCWATIVLSLVDGIVRNKTIDFLIDNAEVVGDEETSRSAS